MSYFQYTIGDARTLPCPWCGTDPVVGKSNYGNGYFAAACNNETCEAGPMVVGRTADEAIAKWNMRAPQTVRIAAE